MIYRVTKTVLVELLCEEKVIVMIDRNGLGHEMMENELECLFVACE